MARDTTQKMAEAAAENVAFVNSGFRKIWIDGYLQGVRDALAKVASDKR